MSNFIRSVAAALRSHDHNPLPLPRPAPGRTVLSAAGVVRAFKPPVRRALETIHDFGANPGGLIMRAYVPPRLEPNPPLVVVLHGCQQTAEEYDKGSGWSKLADRGGFPVLYPEQQASNNPRQCFNWFDPNKTRRDAGEAGSIRAMIAKAIALYGVDPKRIFICGLSAGGAMTCAMLAAYPELFKAGAIIAGLPYGAASSVSDAIGAMFNGRTKTAEAWGDLVRAAGGQPRRWPDIAIWHGSEDAMVKPVNARELVKQWTNVHGLSAINPVWDHTDALSLRRWPDASGEARVTEYMVDGMGHGVPLEGAGGENDGALGPFFIAAGLWSSSQIAEDWGLFDIVNAAADMPVKSKPFKILGFELGWR